MKTLKNLILASVIATTFAAASAIADSAGANTSTITKPQGIYISGNLGAIVGAATDQSGRFQGGVAGVGASAYAGYQFNPYFAIEGGATQMELFLVNMTSVDVAIKGTLPLGRRFSVFGKAGVADNFVTIPPFIVGPTISYSKVSPFVGAGFGFAITHKITATAQYNGVILDNARNAGADGVVGLISLGLTYHF